MSMFLQVMIVRTIMTVRKTTKHAPMMMKERSVSATREATGPLTWGYTNVSRTKLGVTQTLT